MEPKTLKTNNGSIINNICSVQNYKRKRKKPKFQHETTVSEVEGIHWLYSKINISKPYRFIKMALIYTVLVLSIKNCGLTPCHKLVIMEVQNAESMHMNLLLHPFSHQYPQTVDGALLWPLGPFWQQKDSVCFWWCVRCCIAVGQRLQCLIKDSFHFYYPYNLNHSKNISIDYDVIIML